MRAGSGVGKSTDGHVSDRPRLPARLSPVSVGADRLVYKALALLVALLIFTAFLLLAWTARCGPRCSFAAAPTWLGRSACLQSFADLLKFVLKEPLIPAGADKGVFLLAPLVTAVLLALAAWAVVPVGKAGSWPTSISASSTSSPSPRSASMA
jgi:NADH:ubiquinone oxidoreductase subunit H